MKKLTILLILVLIIAGALFIAANTWPSRLRVINNSEEPIVLNMGYPYSYLYVASGGDVTYTVEKDVYFGNVWYCGDFVDGEWDLNRNLRLNFRSCGNDPLRMGERTQEKVDLEVGPKRDFEFQY